MRTKQKNLVEKATQIGGVKLLTLFLCFTMGSVLTVAAYGSVAGLIIPFVLYITITSLMLVCVTKCYLEGEVFVFVFSIGWLVFGVTSLLQAVIGSSQLIIPDSIHFFRLSTELSRSDFSLPYLKKTTEGSLAVLIWNFGYETLSSFGIEKEKYIASLINLFFVSASTIFTMRIGIIIFSNQPVNLKLLKYLILTSGTLHLSVFCHVRDGIILFFLSLLTYHWVLFLSKDKTVNSIVRLCTYNIIITLALVFLRNELSFVPAAFLVAAGFTYIIERFAVPSSLNVFNLTIVPITVGLVLWFIMKGALPLYSAAYSTYSDIGLHSDHGSSLWYSLLFETPLVIRYLVGVFYLQLFPMPFWLMPSDPNVYHLFKSLNSFVSIFIFPCIFIGLTRGICLPSKHGWIYFFVCLCFLGFLSAIVLTSVETRHLFTFSFLGFLICLYGIPRSGRGLTNYLVFFVFTLSLHAFASLSWFVIKSI